MLCKTSIKCKEIGKFFQLPWIYTVLSQTWSVQYYIFSKAFFPFDFCAKCDLDMFSRESVSLLVTLEPIWRETSIQFLRPEEWHVPQRFVPNFREKSWWHLGWNSKSGARYDQNEFQSCWGLQLSSLFALLLYSIVFPVQVITPHSLRLTHHNAITVNILGKMPLIFKRCLLVLLAIPQTYLNQNEA